MRTVDAIFLFLVCYVSRRMCCLFGAGGCLGGLIVTDFESMALYLFVCESHDVCTSLDVVSADLCSAHEYFVRALFVFPNRKRPRGQGARSLFLIRR